METKIRGPITIEGSINVGDGFTGFDPEDIAFCATEMFSAATMLTTNNFPRLSMPEDVTTSAFVGGFNFPDWYETIDVHIGWTNEGAGGQTVIFAWNLRKVLIGQTMAAGTLIGTGLATPAPPANGELGLTQLDPNVAIGDPGGLGYVLGFEIARIGGSDTLQNPIGLVAVGFANLGA